MGLPITRTTMETKTLAECMVQARTLPFIVKCVKGGGEFQEGWVMDVINVSTRTTGQHKGQLQYDFTVRGGERPCRGWRHTSDAAFSLVPMLRMTTELPADIEEFLSDSSEPFGCETEQVRTLTTMLWANLHKKYVDAAKTTI